jgi:hypothetical protein
MTSCPKNFYTYQGTTTNGSNGGFGTGQSFTMTETGYVNNITTTALGGSAYSIIKSMIEKSYIYIREFVNNNETTTTPNALSGSILATSLLGSIINPTNPYDESTFASSYPVSQFIFCSPVYLVGGTKYVVEWVTPPSGPSKYVYITPGYEPPGPVVYAGGQAYDISGINLSFNRVSPMEVCYSLTPPTPPNYIHSYYHGTILSDSDDIYIAEVNNLIIMKMNKNTSLKFLDSFTPFPDISCIVIGGGGAGGGYGSNDVTTAGGGGGGGAAAIVSISGDFILNHGKICGVNDGSYILQSVIGQGSSYNGLNGGRSQLGNIITCGGGDLADPNGGGGQPLGGTFTNLQPLPSYLGGNGGRGGQANNTYTHPPQIPLVDSPYAGQPSQLALELSGKYFDLPTDISNILYSGCGAGGGGSRTQPLTSAGSGHAGGGNTNQAGQFVPYGMYAAGMASGIGRGYASTVFGGGGSGCNGITYVGPTEIGGVGADGTIILYFEALTVSGDYYSYYDVPQSTSFTISPIQPIDFGTRDIDFLSLIGTDAGSFTIDSTTGAISNAPVISPTTEGSSYTVKVQYTYTDTTTEDSSNIEIRIINPVYKTTYDVPYETYFSIYPVDLLSYTDISFTNITPLPTLAMDTTQNIGEIVYYESTSPPFNFVSSGIYDCSVSVTQINNCTWTQDISINISSVPVYDLSYIIAQNATFTINPLYAINEGKIAFVTGKGEYFQIDSGGDIINTDLFSPLLTDSVAGTIAVDISNSNSNTDKEYAWYKPIVMNIDLFYLDSYINPDTIIPSYTLSSVHTYALTSDPIFTINSSSGDISIGDPISKYFYNLSVTLNEPNNNVEWIKTIVVYPPPPPPPPIPPPISNRPGPIQICNSRFAKCNLNKKTKFSSGNVTIQGATNSQRTSILVNQASYRRGAKLITTNQVLNTYGRRAGGPGGSGASIRNQF